MLWYIVTESITVYEAKYLFCVCFRGNNSKSNFIVKHFTKIDKFGLG